MLAAALAGVLNRFQPVFSRSNAAAKRVDRADTRPKPTTVMSTPGTRSHPQGEARLQPGSTPARAARIFLSTAGTQGDTQVARNGTAIRTRRQKSSAQAPRQQGASIPAQRADGHPGGRGLARVARDCVAVVEVARPATFPFMGFAFLRAWSYLRFVIQQARNPRWAAASCGAHARNLPAVRSRRRQKFWPRCTSPGCDRPVPQDAVHELCGRAGPYVALIRAPRHGGPCCPGTCPGCRACLDTPRVQAGWCARCSVCAMCCRGHEVLTKSTIRERVPVRGNLNHPRTHRHCPAHGTLRGAQPATPR